MSLYPVKGRGARAQSISAFVLGFDAFFPPTLMSLAFSFTKGLNPPDFLAHSVSS